MKITRAMRSAGLAIRYKLPHPAPTNWYIKFPLICTHHFTGRIYLLFKPTMEDYLVKSSNVIKQ